MKLSDLEAFRFKDHEDLKAEIERKELDIPFEKDLSPLIRECSIDALHVPNRLCVQPLESCDAGPDGSPSENLIKRYTDYAAGGFGTIWIEASAVVRDGRSNPHQLMLTPNNVISWRDFISAIRLAARDAWNHDVAIVIQLSHAGRFSKPSGSPRPVRVWPVIAEKNQREDILLSDTDLDSLKIAYEEAATRAFDAGADCVDIKCCYNDLLADLLAARTRQGKYGGRLENRAKFLVTVVETIRARHPNRTIAVRLGVYNGVPYPLGFGVDKDDPSKADLREPLQLVKMFQEAGVRILNVTCSGMTHLVHPLDRVGFEIQLTGRIQRAFPDLIVVAGGLSWLRRFAPYVAAGIVKAGYAAVIGLGRAVFASPRIAASVLLGRPTEQDEVCLSCNGCQILHDGGEQTGCVLQNEPKYGEALRQLTGMFPEKLVAEATRCHNCLDAPCVHGCPAGVNVPVFLSAYREGNIEAAYATLRKSLVLPEMSSQLCPTWLVCEGKCVERIVEGKPVAIRDIQYGVCWMAREKGLVRTNVPAQRTGRRIAVVGCGPAGLSAALCLVEKGHEVVIFEKSNKPGGIPELAIPASRYRGAAEEIAALTSAPLESGILKIEFGRTLGADLSIDWLETDFDAVLLAIGVWEEKTIGRVVGVTDAVSFLLRAKSDPEFSCNGSVAVLAGGDCALDAAKESLRLGAKRVFVIYEGEFSQLHWHGPADWFRTPGVHLMALTKPLGYMPGIGGRVGIRLKSLVHQYEKDSTSYQRSAHSENESVLWVDLVVEAMGLGVSRTVRQAISNVRLAKTEGVVLIDRATFQTCYSKVFAAGAMVNGGATVAQCVAEGMQAASAIGRYLGDLL